MDSQWLQNVANVVVFCQQKQYHWNVAYPNVRRDVIHYFLLVKLEDVDLQGKLGLQENRWLSLYSNFMAFISHWNYILLNVRSL
jgi:hypothetical protein